VFFGTLERFNDEVRLKPLVVKKIEKYF